MVLPERRSSMGRTIAIAFACFVLAACEAPMDSEEFGGLDDVPDAIEILEAPETGVSLGWGWNKPDHEPIPTICVEFVEGEELAQTRYMTMEEVTDTYEVMSSLGLSAEASVKTIGVSAKGKAAYAKSLNITGTSSTFVMNAEVHNGVRYAAPLPSTASGDINHERMTYRGGLDGEIRLTREALALARENDRSEFIRRCGHGFVSAIYGGAKLTAVISSEVSSREEKESLKASVSGKGWGVKLKSSLQSDSRETSENQKLSVSIFQTGGSGDAIPVSKQDLLMKMESISYDALVAPKDFNIAVTPYEILENWPKRGLPNKETELVELASYWGSYNTLFDEIQHILDNPGDFAAVTIAESGCVSVTNSEVVPGTVDQGAIADLSARLRREIAQGGVFNNRERLTEYIKELEELSNPDPEVVIADNSANLKTLRDAQDEILAAMQAMEKVALDCVSKSDTCDFKSEDYRSPYAFRLQVLPPDDFVNNTHELIDLNVAQAAKRRCAMSPNNPGCISNAAVDLWHEKIGLVAVRQSVEPDLYATLEAVSAEPANRERRVCANGSLGAPAISVEPATSKDKTIWVNPAMLSNLVPADGV